MLEPAMSPARIPQKYPTGDRCSRVTSFTPEYSLGFAQNGGTRMPNVTDRKSADACQRQTRQRYKPRRTPGLSLESASRVRRNVHNISIRVELNRCPMVPCSCLHAK